MAPVEVDLGTGVRAACTTVADGNLALHALAGAGDDAARVMVRRREVGDWFGGRLSFGHQVHGVVTRYVTGGESDPGTDPTARHDAVEPCDALVTDDPRVALAVLVADCVPVLLADRRAGVIGVAHAGRPGMLDGVLCSVVRAMTERGADPARIGAVLGPCAGPCCYEVPEQMADDAERRVPGVRSRTTWGTPSIDLRTGCRSQLARAGVEQVAVHGGCTIEDPVWFSYRRAAGEPTGRFAGLVRLVP